MADRVPRATIVESLAVTLGDKASVTWGDAVRGLGIPEGDSYTHEQAIAVLGALSSVPGTVGVAARIAGKRLAGGGERRSSLFPDDEPSSVFRRANLRAAPPSDSPPPASVRVDLRSFLAPSLGEEKANETLAEYAKTLNLNLAALSHDDAVAMLDAMSRASGLLGVVARFAKVRFLLKQT